MEHPKDVNGKPLHTYCLGPTRRRDENHNRHPLGIPMRERGQCLWCDVRDDDAKRTDK